MCVLKTRLKGNRARNLESDEVIQSTYGSKRVYSAINGHEMHTSLSWVTIYGIAVMKLKGISLKTKTVAHRYIAPFC